jgi:hypothetical protein
MGSLQMKIKLSQQLLGHACLRGSLWRRCLYKILFNSVEYSGGDISGHTGLQTGQLLHDMLISGVLYGEHTMVNIQDWIHISQAALLMMSLTSVCIESGIPCKGNCNG